MKDEVAQVRLALCQLQDYSFRLQKYYQQENKKVAVFSHEISKFHQELLEESNIFTIWKDGTNFSGTEKALR